jgi:hypothetical protein
VSIPAIAGCRTDEHTGNRGDPVQYMLLICGVEGDEREPDGGGYTIEEWVAEMDGRGVRLQGDRLRPPSDATTVRVRSNEVLISDGPFAETKEQMYGYDLLECADLDEAIEVASKHPMARAGMVELRPVWPLDEG